MIRYIQPRIEGEKILYETTLSIIGQTFNIVAMVFLLAMFSYQSLGIGAILLLPLLFYRILQYWAIDLTITNHRLIIDSSLPRNRVVGVMLKDISNIQIKQPLLGRIFKYGTLIITYSDGSQDILKRVNDPNGFYIRIELAKNYYTHPNTTDGSEGGLVDETGRMEDC